MRAGFKIVMKLGVIGGFLFCTPFFDGMRQLIEESSFLNLLVVRQEVSVDDFSLKNQLNVMSVPQEEEEEGNVSESTIFTSKQPSAPAAAPRARRAPAPHCQCCACVRRGVKRWGLRHILSDVPHRYTGPFP